MSWVDLLILIVVILAGFLGHAEGAVRQVVRFAGFGLGFYLGTTIAPSLSGHITRTGWRPAIALGIVLVASILGGGVGSTVGSLLTQALRSLSLGTADRLAGALVGVAGALVGCWLAAGLLASTTWGSVANGIQHSSILSAMNRVMPPVPALDARVQTLFRGVDFPSVFASVVAPSLGAPVDPRTLGPVRHFVNAPSSVVKVVASGVCATDSEGTAFYVSSNEVVTNAHVVAGHTHVEVGGVAAQVALFDPNNDLAVLRVPGRSEAPLSFLSRSPVRGEHVEVIGFPLDRSRSAAAGVVEGEITARGRDIYNANVISKTILAVEVVVQPGNSGSPVMEGTKVAGIVESKVISESTTAYAIPDGVIARDLAKTRASGTASTQSCLS